MGSNVSSQVNNYTIIGSSNTMDALAIDKSDQRAKLDAQLQPMGGLNPTAISFDSLEDWRNFMDIQEIQEDDHDFFGKLAEWGGKINGAVRLLNTHMDKIGKIGAVIHETYSSSLFPNENDGPQIRDIEAFSDGYEEVIGNTYASSGKATEPPAPETRGHFLGDQDPFSDYYGNWDHEPEYDGFFSGLKDAAHRFSKKANSMARKVGMKIGSTPSDRVSSGAAVTKPEVVKKVFGSGARAVVSAVKRGVESEADIHGSVVSTRTVTAVPPNDHLTKISRELPQRAVPTALERVNESGKDVGMTVALYGGLETTGPKVVGATTLQEKVDRTSTSHGTVRDVKEKVQQTIVRLNALDTDALVLTPAEMPIGMFPVQQAEEKLAFTDVFESRPIDAVSLSGMKVRENGTLTGKFSSSIDALVKEFGPDRDVSVKVFNSRAVSNRPKDVFWGGGPECDHDIHLGFEITTVVVFTSHSDVGDYGCGVMVGPPRTELDKGVIFPAVQTTGRNLSQVHGVVVWSIHLDLSQLNRDGLSRIASTKWSGMFVPVLFAKNEVVSKISESEIGIRPTNVMVAPLINHNYYIYNGKRVVDKKLFYVVCRIQPSSTVTSSNRDMLNVWERMCDAFDGVIAQMVEIFQTNQRLSIIPTRVKCLLMALGIQVNGEVVRTDQDAANWLAGAVKCVRRWPLVWRKNPFFQLREAGEHDATEKLATIIFLILVKVLPMTAFTDVTMTYRSSVGGAVKALQNWESSLVRHAIQ